MERQKVIISLKSKDTRSDRVASAVIGKRSVGLIRKVDESHTETVWNVILSETARRDYTERQAINDILEELCATPSLGKVVYEERWLTFFGHVIRNRCRIVMAVVRRAERIAEGDLEDHQLHIHIYVRNMKADRHQRNRTVHIGKRQDKTEEVCQDRDVSYHQERWRQQVTGKETRSIYYIFISKTMMYDFSYYFS